MEQGIFVNSTDIVYELHPCYEVVNFSYVLARSPSIQCIFIFISLSSFSLVTVCGNLLVIISVGYFKQLHTPTNSLILSLAVTDVLVGLLIFPFSLAFTVTFCIYEEHLICKLRDSFDVVLCTSSILHLCCISIDRYCAVCKPLTYSAKINNHVAAGMILMCWGISVVIGIAIIFAGFNQGKCEADCTVDTLVATSMGPVFSFYLPALIMVVIYLKILLVAQKQARRVQNNKSGATVSKVEKKATKTLAIVMGVFLLCLSPCFLFLVFKPLISEAPPMAVMETLNWLALSNSMLNPFIYGFFYSWFRSAFKIVVTGQIFQGDFTSSKLL